MKQFLHILVLLTITLNVSAQAPDIFLFRDLIDGKDTLPYRVLYPQNYDSTKTYPLVLFLHGAGERGNDNRKQLVHGAKLFLNQQNRDSFPAIVVFPQCPQNSYWSNVRITTNAAGQREFNFQNGGMPTTAMRMLIKLHNNLKKDLPIDQKRQYIGGLSMGAMGTFEMLYRVPGEFAAAIAICGGGNTETVDAYAKDVSLWIFHGAKDNVVPLAYSQEMAAAIKKQGGDVKLTIYPEANHNSWDNAFAEPGLLEWLFSH